MFIFINTCRQHHCIKCVLQLKRFVHHNSFQLMIYKYQLNHRLICLMLHEYEIPNLSVANKKCYFLLILISIKL